MPRVVTDNCKGCKFTDCVTVCPADCFHEADDILYINPVTCIDCDACVPECPVGAIFEESEVPDQWKNYIDLNREQSAKLPVITENKDPLPTAEARKQEIEAREAAGGAAAEGAEPAQKLSPEELAEQKRKQEEERKRKEEEKRRREAELRRVQAMKRNKIRRFVRNVVESTAEARDTIATQEDQERKRRYGNIYDLTKNGEGYKLRLEFPRRIPDSPTKRRLRIPDEMPDYRYDARIEGGALVVEAWMEDPSVQPLIGRAGAFPPGFYHRFELDTPVKSIDTKYEDKTLVVRVR